MSKNLERVIQRAISDAAFRRQLQSNPEAALRGLNLTAGEVAALRSGDAGKLTSLGIDQRMSKTFTFGGDSLASRSSIGGDLTTGSGSSVTDRDLRLNSDVSGGSAGGVNSAVESENTSGATRLVIPGADGSAATIDPGFVGSTASVGDPMSESGTTSVMADPDNPANARGYIGVEAASAATASNLADPDNPASARTFAGGQETLTSDTIEDQGHAAAAYVSQGASAATASNMGDPDNPASARTFIGGQEGFPSDAIEDQGHVVIASRADAFLSQGEVSQYSDPTLSSGQATDEGQLSNPIAGDVIPEDTGTVSVHHEPDIPS